MTASFYTSKRSGYTLIELMVAVGLFALVMTLATGAYLIMIGISRQTQGITSGIDNLSFALETMSRTILTGTSYNCGGAGDCSNGSFFSVESSSGHSVVYSLNTNSGVGVLMQTIDSGTAVPLTDSSLVNVKTLTFYAVGTAPGDPTQARVTIVVSGTVQGQSKTTPVSFTVETGATMRGIDL